MPTTRNLNITKALHLFTIVGLLSPLAAFNHARADEDGKKLRDALTPVHANPLVGKVRTGNGGFVDNFPASKVNLLAWLPLNAFPSGPISAADCWGYVSPSGREYAILGIRNGTAYIEVTDPINPKIIATTSGPDSLWQDVTVIGNRAYSVSEGGWGIRVDDLSQIDAGIVTKIQDKQQLGHSGTHTIVENVDSGYLYLCGTNINNGGLTAVTTANSNNPIIVGAWTNRYVHEAQIVTHKTGPYAGKEIAYLFTGGPVFYGFGLEIADVTDKNNIITLSSYQYPLTGFAHQGWLTPDLKFLYLDDEGDEYGGLVNQLTTRVFDVSNLSNPIQVSTFSNGRTSVDHNQYVKGKYLYQANYRSGLAVWDTTNKLAPTQVAWFDTFPADDSPNFNSLWGNYPFLPSGIVIGSDIEQGMFIWQVDVGALNFNYPQGVPTSLTAGSPTPVNVIINGDDATSLKSGTVKIHVSVNNGAFQDISASPIGGNQFQGTIPSATAGDTVKFYFSAQAGDLRNFSDPAGAPGTSYTASVSGGCYADCDGSGTLNIDDFICFQTNFALGDPQADCDSSGTLNIDDFICFQTIYALGC
jgi:choice-of-anchor B domain-containing protein